MTIRAGVAGSLVVVLAGCTGHAELARPAPSTASTVATAPHPTPESVVHVRALLESTHFDTHGRWHTFHAPLSGEFVRAESVAGERVAARVDARGLATLSLAPGRYVLTLSQRDACYPVAVTVRARVAHTVNLPCAAP